MQCSLEDMWFWFQCDSFQDSFYNIVCLSNFNIICPHYAACQHVVSIQYYSTSIESCSCNETHIKGIGCLLVAMCFESIIFPSIASIPVCNLNQQVWEDMQHTFRHSSYLWALCFN